MLSVVMRILTLMSLQDRQFHAVFLREKVTANIQKPICKFLLKSFQKWNMASDLATLLLESTQE
jgi:hypothetical protein